MEHIVQAVDRFVFRLTIVVYAVFVGYIMVWSVTPAAHPADVGDQRDFVGHRGGALLAVGVAFVGDGEASLWARASVSSR
jgi:hypothetical protein